MIKSAKRNSRILLRNEQFGYVGFDSSDQSPFLVDYGALLREERDHFRIVANPKIPGALTTAPLYLTVFPSLLCNKMCSFCTFRSLLNKNAPLPNTMTPEVSDRIVEVARDYGILVVNILGGEPLLPATFPLVRKLIAQLLGSGTQVAITTNGLTIGRYAGVLHDLLEAYDESFGITVSVNVDEDSNRQSADVFANLAAVHESRLKVSVSTIIWDDEVPMYVHAVDRITGILKECFVRWNLLYPRIAGHRRMAISKYLATCEEIRESVTGVPVVAEMPFGYRYSMDGCDLSDEDRLLLGCGVGKRTLAVGPDGSVYPCATLLGESEFLLGDIRTELSTIWARSGSLRHRYGFKTIPSTCAALCPFYDICDGCLAHERLGTEPECEFADPEITGDLR